MQDAQPPAMESLKKQIDSNRLPQHVAVIMDGNGRWARQHGHPRIFGHRNGVQSVRETTEAAAELGIKWLTLYAFSTENWNRPRMEVDALMSLLVETTRKELETLNKNNIRLQAIGDLAKLPRRTHKALMEGISNTEDNTRMTLTLALNYSGRWDVMQATQRIAEAILKGAMRPEDITEQQLAAHLATAHMPDPELLIRTSGEFRISNFLLWQAAYTELYFTDIFWPEFRKEHFCQALLSYQRRERRFGKTGEQLTNIVVTDKG